MPVSTVGLSLNYGFAGNVSRTPDTLIENRFVNTSSANIPFGAPLYLKTDNTVTMADGSLTASNFAGVAAAEVRQLGSYPTSTASTGGYYAAKTPCDYVTRGIVPVKVAHGTPTAGGAVYVRKVLDLTNFPNEALGDFRADADGSNTVQLTNCCWNTGKLDANNISELKIKSINT